MVAVLQKRLSVFILVAVFVVGSLLGLIVAKAKYQALTGASLDYAYFLEFTSKAFSPTLAHSLAVSPYNGGEDMFFIAGPDGYPIFRWLHTELIKVVPTYLYALTGVLLVPYAFYVFCFFLPLLYGAYLLWNRREENSVLPLALIALATFPSSLLYATDILRPYYSLLPFFVCLVLALSRRRPMLEKTFFLIVLLSIREEALCFAGAALLWEIFRSRRDGGSLKDPLILWGIWGAWASMTAVYYITSGYGFNPPIPTLTLGALVAAGLCVGLIFLGWLWRRGAHGWKYTPDVLFATTAIAPMLVFIFGVDPHHWGAGASLVYSRYSVTLFYACVGVLVAYLYDHPTHPRQKMISSSFLIACIVLGLASELIPHPSATYEYVARWEAGERDAVLVHRAAAIIPVHTPVLLDLTTLIAFYGHDNTYAYDYLPYALASSTGAEFPKNTEPLKKLISSGISYAIVRNAESQPLIDLLKAEKHTLVLIEGNEKFSFYQIK